MVQFVTLAVDVAESAFVASQAQVRSSMGSTSVRLLEPLKVIEAVSVFVAVGGVGSADQVQVPTPRVFDVSTVPMADGVATLLIRPTELADDAKLAAREAIEVTDDTPVSVVSNVLGPVACITPVAVE